MLEVRNLSRSFGGLIAVSDLTFAVEENTKEVCFGDRLPRTPHREHPACPRVMDPG